MYKFRFVVGKAVSAIDIKQVGVVHIAACNQYEAQIKIAEYLYEKKQAGETLILLFTDFYDRMKRKYRFVYIPMMEEHLFCVVEN